MCIYMRSNFSPLFVVLLAVVLSAGVVQGAHPFLIVTEANFPELQSRAGTAPWSTMKSDAISNSGLTYNASGDHKTNALILSNIVSGSALSYILDVGNRSTYQSRLYDAIMVNGKGWQDIISALPGVTSHDFPYCVITGGAFFNTVLALDVMYNGFSAGEISDMEAELQLVADYYDASNHASHWELNLYGCRGIWALYKGNSSDLTQAKADYRDELFNRQITTDGVGRQGPGYPCIRLSHYEREAKGNFMDVLSFTGEDNYYTDPVAINLMEWIYGYGNTPFRYFYTFGDTAPNRNYNQQGASVFRAHRFSEKAGRYAAWNNNGVAPLGRLLHYVLMDQQLLSPERGPSRIFYDGGAWFLEPGLSTSALAAALWNPMATEGHAHSDVGAIHLVAYGEHVIRNSGYAGWNKPSGQWSYVHDEAYSNNTVLINYVDHAQKYGDGITEGFTAPSLGFDYACSDSGPAISNGFHYRSLLFVHPNSEDATNGYWVLFDEVDADNSSHQANVLLHPHADNMSTISSNLEYQSRAVHIKSNESTTLTNTYISIFLGTTPASTSIDNGILTHMSDNYFTGKRLRSNYNTDGSGVVNIVTVLFPSDSTHTKGSMTRISGSGYTGASIAQGGSIVDIALESAGTSLITYSGVSFQGLATWYRQDSGLMTQYFVRGGQSYDDGLVPQVGFASASDVSVYMNETMGRIVSPGTNVTFYYPAVGSVLLNGSPLSPVSSGTNWIQVIIPSGTHEVELQLGPPDPDPPTPNPATWSSAPAAVSSSEITMTATTGTDVSTPVEYYFDETSLNPGGTDSGWVTNPVYNDTGLNPSTQYTYTVQMRDALLNTGAVSIPVANATTDATPDIDDDGDVDFEDFSIMGSQWKQAPGTPSADIAPAGGDGIVDMLDLTVLVNKWLDGAGAPIPDPMTWETVPYATGDTSIAMVATIASDDLTGVEYYFTCTAGGGNNSDWQDSTFYEDTGLTPDTQYTYQVKARDKSSNQNETAYSSPASATTDEDPLVPPPVSLYEFEGDFSNSISGPDATAMGNAQIVTDGERGQVLSLDGSGDYLDCGNDSIEDGGSIILETAMTLTAWIKSSDMDGDDGVISYGWAWRMLGDGGVVRFKNTTLSVADFSGSVAVDDGNWHHIAVTYDSVAEVLAIYVDGEEDVSTACTELLNTWDGYQFAVGYVLSGTHGYFNGLMDDASVYDFALSGEEIQALASQ